MGKVRYVIMSVVQITPFADYCKGRNFCGSYANISICINNFCIVFLRLLMFLFVYSQFCLKNAYFHLHSPFRFTQEWKMNIPNIFVILDDEI